MAADVRAEGGRSRAAPRPPRVRPHTGSVQKWLAGREVIVTVGAEPAGSDLRSPPTALGGPLVRVHPHRPGPDRAASGPPKDGTPVDEPARAPAGVPRTAGPTPIAVPEENP